MDAGANDARQDEQARRPRRLVWRALAIGGGAAALALAIVWSERGDIADHEIGAILRTAGVPATWHIEAIGVDRQVITDVVIGNPAHPDLTIDRVITRAGLTGGVPGLDRVTLVNPRLRGNWRGGRLSFGSLDKLFSGPSRGPFRLPDLALRIDNGRGEIVGDAGVIGVGLTGDGSLRDGFAGALVAVAPHLDLGSCGADAVKLSSRIAVADEQPRLTGPLRLATLRCAGFRTGQLTMPLDWRATAALDGGDGQVGWVADRLALGAARADRARGNADVTLRGHALIVRFGGGVQAVHGGQLAVSSLTTEGLLRADTGGSHITAEGTLAGAGLAPDARAWRMLGQARAASSATPAGPLLARIEQVLTREMPASRLTARFVLRRSGTAASLFVPDARLTGGSGATLLTLFRAEAAKGRAGLQLSGRFTTGGPLPLIAGAMSGNAGHDRLGLTMANYQAGAGAEAAALAIPRLDLALVDGRLGFAGQAVVSGPLPGGAAQDLRLPLAGTWTPRGFTLWPGCTKIAFDRLTLASLTLQRDGLTVCPRAGGAIVESRANGIAVAAGIPTFDLAGQLAGSPIRLTGGPLGIAVPPRSAGTLVASAVTVALGEGAAVSHFSVDRLNASLGPTIGGSFSGSDIDLAAVPLNLRQLAGGWRYDAGVLSIADAAFQVVDREPSARFHPLVARGGVLTLADGVITAQAVLREPHTDRTITRLGIRHDLHDGRGHADLQVDPLQFDKRLQPDALSPLVLGVVADVRGSVAGQGTIDWTNGAVTSQGRFATAALDLAAAFGPVKGLSGTVTFTDLLGLVSAPAQQLKIAAINPGIEVDDGTLTYALLPGHVLAIEGASWPFLDGRLRLLPTRMTLGASEVRRYEMRVDGVDAAKFLVRMNMSNLSATGLFDGGLPLVFDQSGGKVVGGLLASRPPGGSVSYIGTLSYKNLTPMANYAFQTLKSLDYKQLTIGLDGSLSGDIFTRVAMRGVTQGIGARRNFLTRQIGKLPLQFNVNIHAPFYMLMTNFKSLYDSSYVPDPRTLGLLGSDGKPLAHPPADVVVPSPAVAPSTAPASNVQPPVSETKP